MKAFVAAFAAAFAAAGNPAEAESLRIAQWNIGHFSMGGDCKSSVREEKSAERSAEYRAKIAEIDADFIGVSEYDPVFDKAGTPTTNAVFASYPTKVEGPKNEYQCNAVFSRYKCIRHEVVDYDERCQKTYFIDAVFRIGTNEVHFVQSHLDWNYNAQATDARPRQIRQLIDRFRNVPYVIICADFNVYGAGEYYPFVQAGFTIANCGGAGVFRTTNFKGGMMPCSDRTVCDNIIVKGFDIRDVALADEGLKLSDHRILRCTLDMHASCPPPSETVLFDFETDEERKALWAENRPRDFIARVESGLATSGNNAVRFRCEPWREGGMEWPYFMLKPKVKDWRGYDRLAIDIVSLGRGGARLYMYVAGPDGRMHKGLARSMVLEDYGVKQWVVKLDEWPESVSPGNITRMQFVAQQRTIGFDIAIDKLTLLRKGEKPRPPQLSRIGRGILNALADKQDDLKGDREEIEAWRRHMKDYLRFRDSTKGADVLGSPRMLLGRATSMEKIMPRGHFRATPMPKEGVSVRLARNEYEGVQVLVSPKDCDLEDVKIALEGDLKGAGGAVFPASSVQCDVTGYVRTKRQVPYQVGYNVSTNAGPGYVRKTKVPEVGWWPDPLLGFLGGIGIKEFDVQSFWVRVHCPAGQKAGKYKGTLVITARGMESVRVPLSVRVNDFALGRVSELPLALTFDPWPNRQEETERNLKAASAVRGDPESPVNMWKRHSPAWTTFLADYLIPVDHLYHHAKAWDIEPFLQLKADNRLGLVNLGYWEPDMDNGKLRESTLSRLKKNYDIARDNGFLSHAYVYGCDEVEKGHFGSIRESVKDLKKVLPGVPVFTTARDSDYGVGTELDVMDWFCPLTNAYDPEKAKAARAAGHKVWWYICCEPHAPYANMFVECPAIEGRLLMGAQAVKYRPDGFLYYQIATWNSRRCITAGPFTDWEARSWTTYNGDGSWTCVGPDGAPVPTVRLENFRDGLEDYAYATILERRLGEVESGKRKVNGDRDKWMSRARRLLSVPDRVVESMSNYTDNPHVVYLWRDAMADLIEEAR